MGSISVLVVSCGLSLLLVLSYSEQFSGFPLPRKTITFRFQFDFDEGCRFVSVHTVTRLHSINKVIIMVIIILKLLLWQNKRLDAQSKN